MFVVLLKFSDNKSQAGQFIEGHNSWLQKGFDDGVFLLSGGLQPKAGGAVVAHGISLADLEARVSDDPFVAENVGGAQIIEMAGATADERLAFLLN